MTVGVSCFPSARYIGQEIILEPMRDNLLVLFPMSFSLLPTFDLHFICCLSLCREKIMTVPTKEKKREARREEKAEKAAVLEKVTLYPLSFTLLMFLAILILCAY